MNEFTKAQEAILRTLLDVYTHENHPIILKNKYHSTAQILVNRGLVKKTQSGFDRPLYSITEGGISAVAPYVADPKCLWCEGCGLVWGGHSLTPTVNLCECTRADHKFTTQPMEKHFKIVWDEGAWVRLEDASPMLDGSPRKWDGGVWGTWSVDYGIVPDFYYTDQISSAERCAAWAVMMDFLRIEG